MYYVWGLELNIGEADDKETAYRQAAIRLQELGRDGFLGLAREGGLTIVESPRLQPLAEGEKVPHG